MQLQKYLLPYIAKIHSYMYQISSGWVGQSQKIQSEPPCGLQDTRA